MVLFSMTNRLIAHASSVVPSLAEDVKRHQILSAKKKKIHKALIDAQTECNVVAGRIRHALSCFRQQRSSVLRQANVEKRSQSILATQRRNKEIFDSHGQGQTKSALAGQAGLTISRINQIIAKERRRRDRESIDKAEGRS
jgi:hypothetical protein